MSARSAFPEVLVLTADLDPTADRVLAHLLERGVPFTRFDPSVFPIHGALSAVLDGGGRWSGVLRGGPRDVDLSALRAIWCRRPGEVRIRSDVEPTVADWCAGQAREGLWGVLAALPGVRWVNDPDRARSAASKPRHLAAAAACGLVVPATLVTTVPADVSGFARAADGRVVTKPLYPRSPRDAEGNLLGVLYTERVPPDRFDDPAIAVTAHQFQHEIWPRSHAVRVTVVGSALFAVEIHARSPAAQLDWRTEYAALRYRPTRLPAEIEAAVVRLLDRLGLVFAALDFVVTEDGTFHFVDLNPSGQWLWMESEAGQPISSAVADLLGGG